MTKLTDSKLEQAARALCVIRGYDWPRGADLQKHWLDQARAVIEAIREPTQGMREAFVELALGTKLSHEHTWGDYAQAQWQAMIDTLLSEQTP